MVGITRQLGRITRGQDNFQSRIANTQDQYKYALLSGQGSLNMLRDQEARQRLALGYKRQDEMFWVNEMKEALKANKALLGLSTLTAAA